eukprot:scaffold126205_cov36-Tisochrysis_lutea.AAC.2
MVVGAGLRLIEEVYQWDELASPVLDHPCVLCAPQPRQEGGDGAEELERAFTPAEGPTDTLGDGENDGHRYQVPVQTGGDRVERIVVAEDVDRDNAEADAEDGVVRHERAESEDE